MAKFYLCGFNLIILSLIITNVISQLFEGDVCKTDENNVAWKCTKLTLCETAFERLRDEKPPPSCGFAGNIPIVCCEPKSGAPANQPPPPDVTPFRERPQSSAGSSISEQKCKEYAKYVFKDQEVYFPDYEDETPAGNKEKIDTCHNIKPLIVGGTPAAPREFPHQVNIGYQYGNVKKWLCTGSLISENFVLSAAHCSRTSRFGRARFAVVGDLDIGSVRDEADPEEIKIAEIINHPSYRSPYNDIALFRLERNVSLNEFKRPACLQRDRVLPSNNAIATGWGNIRTGGPSSNRLLKADLEIIPKATCDIYFQKGNPLTRGIDDEQMICAGDLKGIKDTCQGDSGGPLQIALHNPYCMYSVVGVTSFGKQCGSQIPGVYTRVSYYVPWIESVVWG